MWFVRLEDIQVSVINTKSHDPLEEKAGKICLEFILAVQMNVLSHYSIAPLTKQAIVSPRMLIFSIRAK